MRWSSLPCQHAGTSAACLTDSRSCLLQALPWRATSSEKVDEVCWEITLLGSTAVCRTLVSILAADVSVRGDVLRDGSWVAALRRVR